MRAYGMTDIGKERSINQDYIFCQAAPIGNLPNLFIVADGMGGHRAGDVASRLTVETFVEYIKESKNSNPITLIDEGICLANERLMKEALIGTDYQGMGTTIVVATIFDNNIYIANVGDSRMYLINDTIRQITRDHSLVEEMVSIGELDKQNARQHKKKNIITRAIGAAKNVIPDFFEIECEPGDKLLMCSDGLTNMVDDTKIKRIVNGNKDIQKVVETLIDEANTNGGKDNISAVLIQMQYDNN